MNGGEGGSLLTNGIIGAVAGTAAVWVMDRLDWFNFMHEAPEARRRTQSVRPGGMDPAHVAAKRVSDVVGHELTPKDNNFAGTAVHYSIGILPGALYGALRRRFPALTAGGGAVFGLSLFFVQDEGLNTLSGLTAKPQRYPWQAHARGFVAHAVYGLVLNGTLNLVDTIRRR